LVAATAHRRAARVTVVAARVHGIDTDRGSLGRFGLLVDAALVPIDLYLGLLALAHANYLLS
jgi:hypothetical protein